MISFVSLYILDNLGTVANQNKYPSSLNCHPFYFIFEGKDELFK